MLPCQFSVMSCWGQGGGDGGVRRGCGGGGAVGEGREGEEGRREEEEGGEGGKGLWIRETYREEDRNKDRGR